MSASAAGSIPAQTRPGTVRLRVSDLSRSRQFYERVLGLPGRELDGDRIAFSPRPDRALVEVTEDRSAEPLNRRRTGLFHLALLVPSRLELARALARVGQARWPLDGASDHLVSEALYLSDPDGNGIEVYRDRPRSEWRQNEGELAMATLPLDLRSVLDELGDDARDVPPVAPEQTGIGHVHLQVAELRDAEAFYSGVLGFEVMVRSYPGALFVAAGGYHHHLGLNTWHSAGASPPSPRSVGLQSFEIVLPDVLGLQRLLCRVQAEAIPMREEEDGILVRDPSGNAVLLRTA